MTSSEYKIPNQISTYIRQLEIMYRKSKRRIYYQIICNASIHIREATEHEYFGNDDAFGHDVIFFLEEEVLEKITSFDFRNKIQENLRNDLNECSKDLYCEFISNVFIKPYYEEDHECSKSIKHLKQTIIPPETVSSWRSGYIRLFISHRDNYKKQVSQIADILESYGVSSFVAHDNIEPMDKWKCTILKCLHTMEIMLAFITEDFSDSLWTNQEIGFAIGKGIPIIPLKIHKADPCGFIEDIQAIIGDEDDVKSLAGDIYKVLVEKLGQGERLKGAIIQALIQSPNFEEARIRFDRLSSLTTLAEDDINQIINGFEKNDQLHNATYLNNHYQRFVKFLNKMSSKKYSLKGKSIIEETIWSEDDIPF